MAHTNVIYVIMLDHHKKAHPDQWPIVFAGDLEGAKAKISYSESDLRTFPRSQWAKTFVEEKILMEERTGENNPGAIFEMRAEG